MWIVAIGWAYVVILMAATETSVIAGIMTFFGYGVLPLSILFYLAGAGRRRRRRADASAHRSEGPSAADAPMPLLPVPAYAPLAEGGGASSCPTGADGADGGCGGGD
jgi:hypothetical protein